MAVQSFVMDPRTVLSSRAAGGSLTLTDATTYTVQNLFGSACTIVIQATATAAPTSDSLGFTLLPSHTGQVTIASSDTLYLISGPTHTGIAVIESSKVAFT